MTPYVLDWYLAVNCPNPTPAPFGTFTEEVDNCSRGVEPPQLPIIFTLLWPEERQGETLDGPPLWKSQWPDMKCLFSEIVNTPPMQNVTQSSTRVPLSLYVSAMFHWKPPMHSSSILWVALYVYKYSGCIFTAIYTMKSNPTVHRNASLYIIFIMQTFPHCLPYSSHAAISSEACRSLEFAAGGTEALEYNRGKIRRPCSIWVEGSRGPERTRHVVRDPGLRGLWDPSKDADGWTWIMERKVIRLATLRRAKDLHWDGVICNIPLACISMKNNLCIF